MKTYTNIFTYIVNDIVAFKPYFYGCTTVTK